MHNVGKCSCGVNIPRFLKHMWPFLHTDVVNNYHWILVALYDHFSTLCMKKFTSNTAFLWSGGSAQKMKFSIKDFFRKCNQIRSFQQIWLHLLKKSLIENFIFCAVWSGINLRSSYTRGNFSKRKGLGSVEGKDVSVVG